MITALHIVLVIKSVIKKMINITLLVDRNDCGLPLHATPVGTSLCSLKLANGIYGLRISHTFILQSTTRAQLAM